MDRRRFLAATTAVAAVGVAGCTGDGGDGGGDGSAGGSSPTDSPTEATDTSPTGTTGRTADGTPTEGGTDRSPTGTAGGTPGQESVLSVTGSVYDAWAALDADAFLAHLHTTNNHPEQEVRQGAEEIDFSGTVEALNGAVVAKNLTREELEAALESTRIQDQAGEFVDVRTARVRVDPEIAGETPTDRAADFKSFLSMQKKHLLAVEDGEWRFVG